MSDIPFLRNALAWAHHRLRGGRRSAIVQATGFFFIVGGLVVLAVRADPHETRNILYGWMHALLALQVAILLLYGGAAVRNAIRRDATTGMIASHRLMPISGAQAVSGYVLGACPQPLAVGGANLLLGILVAGPARVNPTDWIAANALLALFAACSWVVIACASLVSPKSAGAVLVALIAIALSGGFLLTIVPAFSVICSPLVGSTIFGIVMKGAAWSPDLHLSIMCQFIVTGLFFVAAARKYRRDDVLAVGPLLGMVIVALFVGITLVGIRNWSSLQPMIATIIGDLRPLQVIGSMTAGVMVSMLPIAAGAWLAEEHRRRRILKDPALGRRPVNCVFLAVAAGLLLVLIAGLGMPAGEVSPRRVLSTAVCLVATLVPIAYLLRLIYRTRATVGFLLSLWIALAWVGPWVISFAVLAAYGIDEATRVPVAWSKSEYVAAFSPIGSLISIWTNTEMPWLTGLIFQAATAGGMALLYHTRRATEADLHVPVVAAK